MDAHFGWAKHLAVYEVTADSCTFVEDFAFGFGMVTLAMLLWVRLGRREQRGEETA